MDFNATAVYSQLKREMKDTFEVVVLPPGSVLYRTSARGESSDPTKPVFLGDHQMVTMFYGNRGAEARTLFSYTTTKPSTLLVMSLPNLKALATGSEAEFVYEWYVKPRKTLPPSVFKSIRGPLGNLGKKPETPIIIPAHAFSSAYDDYTNRHLAQTVCAKGFDGWVVFPDSVVEYDSPNYLYGRQAAVYSPEVVICPDASSPPTVKNMGRLAGGRRQTRKTRRRSKKTRKQKGF